MSTIKTNTFRSIFSSLISVIVFSSLFAVAGLSIATSQAGATEPSNILSAGNTLSEGQYLVSGSYALYMQPDGNLVLYENWGGPGNVGTPIWATMTFNWQSNNQGALTLYMQPDGNLVLYSHFASTSNVGTPVWATMKFGSSAYLDLQTDRNLVVYAATGYTWASWTQLPPPPAVIPSSASVLGTGQTLTEGNYLVNGTNALYMQPDGNLVVYVNWGGPGNVGTPIWATMTFNWQNNNQGPLTLYMQPDGNLVLYSHFASTSNVGTYVWATMKFGPSSYLSIQADTNLVTYSDPGYPSNPLGAYTWNTGITTANRIVLNEQSEIGYRANPDPNGDCNAFTAYFGRGSDTDANTGSLCASGTRSEAWCSDFANWAWYITGVNVAGLNAYSYSFVTWGQAHGTFKPGPTNHPQIGDAVVWATGPSNSAHVGTVVGVSNGLINVLSGNDGNGGVSESGYYDPATWTVDGDPIIGYVSP